MKKNNKENYVVTTSSRPAILGVPLRLSLKILTFLASRFSMYPLSSSQKT